ncbi:MAG: SpoVG family protein, partial [Phycisphaerae bacterium]
MEITETRVKLVNNANDRLKAYCSITIDGCFVVRDLKVIDGSNGLFVAMPSRKLATRCPNCSSKNHLRARFCNECGKKTSDGRSEQTNARTKLHADVAHPINAECRQFIQERVIEEFQVEAERSRQPDYVAADYDDYEDNEESPYDSLIQELKAEQQTGRKER